MNHPIFPALKAPDWVGKDLALCRRLIPGGEQIPWLGFGLDDPLAFRFLSVQDQVESLEMVEQQAIANIEGLNLKWDKFDFGSTQALSSTGNYFSAEKILDRNFLFQAQNLLDTNDLLVSIPRRSVLYAINAEDTEDALDKFYHVTKLTFWDDTYANAPISPLIFKVRNGLITGIVPQFAERFEQDKDHKFDFPEKAYVFEKNIEHEENGQVIQVSALGSEDLYALGTKIRYKVNFMLANHFQHKKFSNQVGLIILGEYTPFTPELVDMLADLENDFRQSNFLGSMMTPESDPVFIRMDYYPKKGEENPNLRRVIEIAPPPKGKDWWDFNKE